MSYYLDTYERETNTMIKWMVGFFIVFGFFVGYISITEGYEPTGKVGEMETAVFNIDYSTKATNFRVSTLDRNYRSEFNCSYQPAVKKATLAYRQTEVKTLSGKYRTVPIFDRDISCRNIRNGV